MRAIENQFKPRSNTDMFEVIETDDIEIIFFSVTEIECLDIPTETKLNHI